MDSLRLIMLFSFSYILLHLASLIVAQPEFLHPDCRNLGNYTTNSTFGRNLNSLLSSLVSNTQINYGFYNLSVPQTGPDRAYAIALCRGDIGVDDCRGCIRNATNKILQVCPNRIEAIGVYDTCMLRYSNKSIIGVMEGSPVYMIYIQQNATDVTQFNQALQTLLRRLRNTAVSGNSLRKFATGKESAGFHTIYGLVQCTPDLSDQQCDSCLAGAIRQTSACCTGLIAARITTPSCNLRYDLYDFLGSVTPATPPAEGGPVHKSFTEQNVTDPIAFNQTLQSLLRSLQNTAVSGNSLLMFATGHQNDGFETIYALVNCTPDLSYQQCNSCLARAISEIPDGAIPVEITTTSCNLRYDISDFFGSVTPATPQLPTPLSPQIPRIPSPPPAEGKKGNKARTIIIIVIPTVSVVILIICICICIFLRIRKPKEKVESLCEIEDAELLQLDFSTVRAATDNFSKANKLGKGGFGAVYKGTLPNGQEIAVKRLSRSSGQGEPEFKNEVILVAKLQHRNLVRLQGFCLEKEERLLVYEFLPNSSLNNFIFDPVKRVVLDWEKSYKIITSIARGLLYLHEDSRLRIIHRDLKASNILLDAEMNPKIADFGMARLFAANQTQDNTNRVVGTFGYMAPEYITRGHFSMKSDVFSFGVLVLEIVSGKKNYACRIGDPEEDLLSYSWRNWNEGTALDIIDPTLNVGSISEMMRCIHIGLLCVQENEALRPTMAEVSLMLSSYSVTPAIPSKPAFFTPSERSAERLPSSEYDPMSNNEVTISELNPR